MAEFESVQLENGRYHGELNERGEKHGHGTYEWTSGTRFEGEWIRDNAVSGTYYYRNGATYQGGISTVNKTICWSGKGKLTQPSGLCYEGEFEEKCSGSADAKSYTLIIKGRKTYPDGSYYIGTFLNYTLEGKGTQYMSDGRLFSEGEYKHGVLNGHGVVYYTKDWYQEGECENGNFNGHGILHKGERTLECEFRDGRAFGEGISTDPYRNTVTRGIYEDGVLVKTLSTKKYDPDRRIYTIKYSNGNRYVGEAKDGMPNGYGTFYDNSTYTTGREYTGYFVNGKIRGFAFHTFGEYQYEGELCGSIRLGFAPHGMGTKFYSGGGFACGTFRNGDIRGWVKLHKFYPQVEWASGIYRNESFRGTVAIDYENGHSYQGRIKDWLPHGKGVYSYSDTRYLAGSFKRGKPHGRCRLYEDNCVYLCIYKNGARLKKDLISSPKR